MRLDLLLKQSGLIKRRVIAQQYCERGLVTLNGKISKPSTQVKDGDVLEIIFGEKKAICQIRITEQENKSLVEIIPMNVKNSGGHDA